MSTEDLEQGAIEASTTGRCAQHPALDAIGTCDRCGNFVCATCRLFYDYISLCPACRERRTHDTPASPRARWALILAVIAMALMVIPLGFPAVFLAHGELSAIEAGEAPAGGRGYAKVAVLLGWCANLIFTLGVVSIAALLAFAYYTAR